MVEVLRVLRNEKTWGRPQRTIQTGRKGGLEKEGEGQGKWIRNHPARGDRSSRDWGKRGKVGPGRDQNHIWGDPGDGHGFSAANLLWGKVTMEGKEGGTKSKKIPGLQKKKKQ